ncbi:MAG TPA: NADH-quinone oxidoreductase subunit N [Pirellulales bacterium]|nr:NADH-quinone oxidoreductase subunit N [Pirellulales bacterium]
MSTDTVYRLLPEGVLILVASLIYVVGAFLSARRVWAYVALAAMGLAAAALVGQQMGSATPPAPGAASSSSGLALDTAGHIDALGQYVRWLALVVGAVLMLLSSHPDDDAQEPELIGTLLLAVAGAMLVATTRDLVLLFLGIELISIPTYVLLYLGRRDASSPEATAKYFFLSILSSALTLYGFSFLYGIGGSTDLAGLHSALLSQSEEPTGLTSLATIGLVLVFAGIGFKITAVPFHFYAPDVYQGTTNGNAGVLAVLPKIAGFVALVRIVAVGMPGMENYAWKIALVLSVLTMTLGNVLGLWQDNIRRLLAYSSIAHSGYMLIGLAVGLAGAGENQIATFDGLGPLFFYLAVYALATAGTFAALTYLGGQGKQIDTVDELAGLARTNPLTAVFLAVFLFSLMGIPPLAGFTGKLLVFASALNFSEAGLADHHVRQWFLALAVLGVVNATIAAGYYLRVVAAMYFRPQTSAPASSGGIGPALAAGVCALLVVLVGLVPTPLATGATEASIALRASSSSVAADGEQPSATVAGRP